MGQSEPGDVTRLLQQLRNGDKAAEEQLIDKVYVELRRIARAYMRRERADHTLQTTALVHEAYMKLVGQKGTDFQNRAHFYAVAAQIMRRILVDYARGRLAEKRGAGREVLPLDEALVLSPEKSGELVALDDALERLQQEDQRVSRVVELRFFGGLTVDETAEVLNVSARTVKREWSFGRAWLRAELGTGGPDETNAMGAS